MKKKSIWAYVLAFCLIVPAIFMFTACNKDKDKTEKHVHTFSTEWTADETHHWRKATCEHTDKTKDYAEHIGDWVEVTPADYGKNKTEKQICSVCLHEEIREVENSALAPKTNTISVDGFSFVYSGNKQSIDKLITAKNNVGMVVEYEGTNGTTYAKSTTAPTNAGSYKYTITVPATKEWAKGEATDNFVIRKYQVSCPDEFITYLPKGQTTTTKLHEIDLTEKDDINLDEVELIYYNPDNPEGYGAGRVNIGANRITVDSKVADNIELTNLPSNNSLIEWLILDDSDAFCFRFLETGTAGSCYIGTITHGYVTVGDKLTVLDYNSETKKLIKVGVTVTKVEYYNLSKSKYIEKEFATKGEKIKITFTKDNESYNISTISYIISAQNVDEINTNIGYKSRTVDLSLGSSEFRMLKIKINTNTKCKLTISNAESSKLLKVFDVATGEEIALTDSTFQVEEGTEVYILIQQGLYEGSQQVKVELVEYTFGA